MKLSEVYEEMMIKDAWSNLEKALNNTLTLEEENSKLNSLLNEADKVIFDKFSIEPSEKKYFIAGSARLYLYPGLIDVLNRVDKGFQTEPGDLDVVVPNTNDWKVLANNMKDIDNPKFNELANKGIYRPNMIGLTNMDIEAFTVWDPSKAGGDYKDVNVRNNKQILNDASLVNGYYFMSLYDVLDYKSQMSREKEIQIANIINKYLKSGSTNKDELFNRIGKIVGMRYA
jgi:hypothetical protein